MTGSAVALGVRFEVGDTRPTRPMSVRLGVAGFVGFAERGPLHQPVRVQSWSEYKAAFGGFGTPGHLPHSARLFFENGGRTLYVVRVAVAANDTSVSRFERAAAAFGDLPFQVKSKAGALRVVARSSGRWGNKVDVVVSPERPQRATIVVREENRVWRLPDASIDPEDDRYLGKLLAKTAGAPIEIGAPPAGAPDAVFVARTVRLRGGRDGIAKCTPSYVAGAAPETRGLSALGDVDDVAIIAIPDSVPFLPERLEQHGMPPPQPCSAADPPASTPSYYPVPEKMPLFDAAGLLGTTVKELRAANPQLKGQDAASEGTVLVVPRPPAAAEGDPSIPAPDWAGVTRAKEVVDQLTGIAERHGLTLHELLAANPAYRPAARPPEGWTPPQVPILVPEPPPEMPPQWSWEETLQIAKEAVKFCETRRDCVALLDPPATALEPSQIISYRASFDSSFAAVYWPWLVVRTADVTRGSVRVPPSGAVAGLTAATDLASGPHRSPAGNVVRGVVAATSAISEDEHARLNEQGINVLRERAATGVVLEGARSLSSDRQLRYFTVRRTLLAIREALEEKTQWVVFESARPAVWADLQDQVRAFLTTLWRRGWLSGTNAEDSFYVRCDESTNPALVQDAGMIVAVIGLRFPPPIEWIVVRIGRSGSALEMLDVM